MQPKQYEAWDTTQRGAWIGEEKQALRKMLRASRRLLTAVAFPNPEPWST
ncbi:MAG: hypothetical protein Q8O64_07575 [Sideroxyarcus sp.]|nr:hypothetical protein [Sideroxyarcus sp.]